jgi:hypothetical protein
VNLIIYVTPHDVKLWLHGENYLSIRTVRYEYQLYPDVNGTGEILFLRVKVSLLSKKDDGITF